MPLVNTGATAMNNKEMRLLQKATEGDKARILAQAVSNKYSIKEGDSDFFHHGHEAYMVDYDDTHVYWNLYVDGQYVIFKSEYTFSGTSATMSDSFNQVVLLTEPTDVSEAEVLQKDSGGLKNKLISLIEKTFGDVKGNKMPIIKQLDDEEMVAIEPLYIAVGDVDGVGDTYMSPEVCYSMVESFNKAIVEGKMSGSYFHKMMTKDFSPVKAWVNEVDCMIGDTLVKEGQPLVKVKFANEKAWEARKSGDLMGVSIGAIADWEEVK